MKELEEGDEACPICNAINNVAAAEIRCNHFVALCWENELHWVEFFSFGWLIFHM